MYNSKKMLSFNQFINESESYQIPGINNYGSGGYEISVSDITNKDEKNPDCIMISDINGHSIELSYSDMKGKTHTLCIPKDSITISRNGNGEMNRVVMDPYKKWMSISSNKIKIDDFIEEFADCMEISKKYGTDSLKTSAKDDTEMIIDLLALPGSISSFNSCGDYKWEAHMDNGMCIEINKRDRNDFFSSIKIFLKKTDHVPSISIDNKKSNKETKFIVPGIKDVSLPVGFSELRNPDPYVNYLTKKSIGLEKTSDQELLHNHFHDLLRSKHLDSEKVNNMIDLLSEFMDRKDIDLAYSKYMSQ